MQIYKPDSVCTEVHPYHLSRPSIAQWLHLPTPKASGEQPSNAKYTWHFTA